jgi:dihydroxyacetone kinase-like protein
MPTIDSEAVRAYLERCHAGVARHAELLNRLDAALGDGDHGDNLVSGFAAVRDALASADLADPPGTLLRSVGYRLVGSVGGASGPLYGTAFIQAGLAAGSTEAIEPALLGTMLRAGAAALARRGRCAEGDKTIYDALAPAVEAYTGSIDAGEPVERALAAATRAAWRGFRATRPLVARRGLALRLGDRSRGHLDPGAASCFLLVRALVPTGSGRHLGISAAIR